MLEYFEQNIATFPPAVWCNKKGVHFLPIRAGIPFKWEVFTIVKIENDVLQPGTKFFNEYTTYQDGKPILNVYDTIINIYKQLALKK